MHTVFTEKSTVGGVGFRQSDGCVVLLSYVVELLLLDILSCITFITLLAIVTPLNLRALLPSLVEIYGSGH
jgi:hypothetical protein